MPKRRKSSKSVPRISLGVKPVAKQNGTTVYGWTCPWCLDGFRSPYSGKVANYAVRHLNAHLRAAAQRSPQESEA